MPVERAAAQDDICCPVWNIKQPAIHLIKRQLAVIVIGIQSQSQPHILLIDSTDSPSALFSDSTQSRKENAHQKSNDGDYY